MGEHRATSGTRARICPLCEACCGLTVEMDGERIASVWPNASDVFSRGHSCPKGLGLGALADDPDRLTAPLVRRGRTWSEASWDEAFDVVEERLAPILDLDRNACAVYLGNPYAHNLDLHLYGSAMLSALRTRNVYSAASVDSMPKHVSNGLMFGTSFGVAVPDLERTDHLLVLGSNLLVSNGSLMSAPGLPGKLRDLRRRGGRLVVVDPVRTRTAAVADEHVPIRPGADAYLLAAMVGVIAEESLVRLRSAAGHVAGLEDALAALATFTPERVAGRCGISAPTIRRMARELATAERAGVHGRIGTTTQEFGTLTSWLVDVLNVITGNLDREGGVMFALPPGGAPNTRPARPGAGWPHDRWRSRVRGAPEFQGELPVACLAEEIQTPGAGRVRALVTVAGNPARSVPHSARLEQSFGELDLMVAVDSYLNETTRHADVILPAPRLTTRGHFDLTINQNATHNAARYSPPLVPLAPWERSEREIMLRLAGVCRGDGWRIDVERADNALAEKIAGRLAGPLQIDPARALAAVAPHRGSERLLDLHLRTGPYGDRLGECPGLTLAQLLESPDGVDYGPLRPRLPGSLRTPSGRVELAPPFIVADVDRLRARLEAPAPDLVLVGRRQVRGMNSWLHNALPPTRSGPCTLHLHPADAERLGVTDGQDVDVRSDTGELRVQVELTDSVPTGVVSLPHGWGHSGSDLRLRAATAQPGVNVNLLVGDTRCEPLTHTPCFTGVAVEVSPAPIASDLVPTPNREELLMPSPPSPTLDGRVALVTGGSRGVGRAIALRLAADGAAVAVNYRRDSASADDTVAEIEKAGGTARAYRAPIGDAAAVRAMLADVDRDLGTVDLLVSNAGTASSGLSTVDSERTEYQRLLDVHLLGPLDLIRDLVPGMRRAPRSDIVVIGSIVTDDCPAGAAPYAVAKSAMESAARTLALEERVHGVRVNVVAPGLVATDMGERLVAANGSGATLADLDRAYPFARVCRPEDVAGVVSFLASVDGSYVTGQRIRVDGGGVDAALGASPQ